MLGKSGTHFSLRRINVYVNLNVKVSAPAKAALKDTTLAALKTLIPDAVEAAKHRGSKTLEVKDIRLIMAIKRNFSTQVATKFFDEL